MTNHLTEAQERERFEAAFNYGKAMQRWPEGAPWDGPYIIGEHQRAWEMWLAAKADATALAAKQDAGTTSAASEVELPKPDMMPIGHPDGWTAESMLAFRAEGVRAALAARPVAQPDAGALPHPGGVEISALLDSILSEYNWPSNPKNAARAGWTAAMRYLAASTQATQAVEPVAREAASGADQAVYDSIAKNYFRDGQLVDHATARVGLDKTGDAK